MARPSIRTISDLIRRYFEFPGKYTGANTPYYNQRCETLQADAGFRTNDVQHSKLAPRNPAEAGQNRRGKKQHIVGHSVPQKCRPRRTNGKPRRRRKAKRHLLPEGINSRGNACTRPPRKINPSKSDPHRAKLGLNVPSCHFHPPREPFPICALCDSNEPLRRLVRIQSWVYYIIFQSPLPRSM